MRFCDARSRSDLSVTARLRRALVVTIVTVVSVPALAAAQYNTAELSGVVKDAKVGFSQARTSWPFRLQAGGLNVYRTAKAVSFCPRCP